MAPRVKAAAHVNAGSIAWATAATATIATSTMTTANRTIGPIWRRKSRSGNEIAPRYRSGGTNTTKSNSGGIAMRGSPGMNATNSPHETRRAG